MEYLPQNSQQMVAKSGAVASARDSAASDCIGNVKSKVLQEGDWFEFLHLISHTSLLHKWSYSQEGRELNISKRQLPREGNPWAKPSGLSPGQKALISEAGDSHCVRFMEDCKKYTRLVRRLHLHLRTKKPLFYWANQREEMCEELSTKLSELSHMEMSRVGPDPRTEQSTNKAQCSYFGWAT